MKRLGKLQRLPNGEVITKLLVAGKCDDFAFFERTGLQFKIASRTGEMLTCICSAIRFAFNGVPGDLVLDDLTFQNFVDLFLR